MKTPGQAAFEAFKSTVPKTGLAVRDWSQLPDEFRNLWERSAKAAIHVGTKSLDTKTSREITEMCCADDPETDRMTADGLLIELLKSLGYTKTVKALDNVKKYYA